jgi:hypothetical protein
MSIQPINIQPLELLPYQSGMIQPPLVENAAKGNTPLDVAQRAAIIGAPIPIVFCRRIDDAGGVLVSPAATEGRYVNNSISNELTVSLALVLSEGELPLLQLRDVFQRACRVGTWAQAFEDRAGTWTRGNFITEVAGKTAWDCPYYCGTGGNYGCMTTLSYTNSFADGDDTWSKQVHAFVREGMQVNRILDSTYGSSNNVVDLALYLIRESGRVSPDLIDADLMESAALFCDVNEFYFNGVFEESINLEDWLAQVSSDFLLRIVEKDGKKGLRPRIPANVDGSIDTSEVSWVFGFTEEHIIPDGFEIQYISLAERKPICAQMLWRQQPDDDIGIIRTAEVRFDNQAVNGPYEQYDLSQFCATENHAVKVGAYRVVRRQYISHTLRIQIKPDAYNGTLILGDIVRVQLRRETNVSQVTFHDYLYEVERIDKALSGIVTLDLTHFPIDSQGRSITAMAVDAAVGDGVLISTGRADFSCDVPGRREDDETLLEYESNDTGEAAGEGYDGGGGEGSGYGGGGNTGNGGIGGDGYGVPSFGDESPPLDGISNPSDVLGQPIGAGITGDAVADSTVETQPVCAEAQVNWYKIPKNANTWNDETGEILDYSAKELVSTEIVTGGDPGSLTLTTDDIDHIMYAEWRCADPSQPDGYGTPVPAGNTTPVEPDITQYQFARFVCLAPTPFTTQWVAFGGPGQEPFLYLIGLRPISSGAFGNVSGSSNTQAAWRSTVNARAIGASSGYGVGGVGGVPAALLPVGTISVSSNSEIIQFGFWEFTNSTVSGPEITWQGRPDS